MDSATATHYHIVARTVVGATFPIPGDGLFRYYKDVTEFCACGARCRATEYIDAEGFTMHGMGIWEGGRPGA